MPRSEEPVGRARATVEGPSDTQWAGIQHPDTLPVALAWPSPLKQGSCFGVLDLI